MAGYCAHFQGSHRLLCKTSWTTTALYCVLCLVTQWCLTLCNSMDCSLSGSSVHGDSLGQNTGVCCHALLQGIFPIQGLNPGVPHCRWILCHLSHQGNIWSADGLQVRWERKTTQKKERGVLESLCWLLNSSQVLSPYLGSVDPALPNLIFQKRVIMFALSVPWSYWCLS